MLNRESENEVAYFRCDRYFTVGHEWYVTTREGTDLGPYTTRHEAELMLAHHLTNHVLNISKHIGAIAERGERDATMLEVLIQELASCQEQSRLRTENSAYAWAQQRLAKFEEHPAEHDHADIRTSALKHFLSELDS